MAKRFFACAPLEPWVVLRLIFQSLTVVTLLSGAVSLWRFDLGRPASFREDGVSVRRRAEAGRSWLQYAAIFSRRNIFVAGPTVVKPRRVVKPPLPPAPVIHIPTLQELAADLTLVGIVNGPEPEAVITNKKTNETLNVKTGQRIGDVTVAAIQDNHVTLSYNNQTLDLSL